MNRNKKKGRPQRPQVLGCAAGIVNLEPLLTCDVCRVEIRPTNLGTTTADTVLCLECVRRAVRKERE